LGLWVACESGEDISLCGVVPEKAGVRDSHVAIECEPGITVVLIRPLDAVALAWPVRRSIPAITETVTSLARLGATGGPPPTLGAPDDPGCAPAFAAGLGAATFFARSAALAGTFWGGDGVTTLPGSCCWLSAKPGQIKTPTKPAAANARRIRRSKLEFGDDLV
jgi:hypothetical protein